ncbi:MAG: hypothetical protein AB7G75_31240 [Candidatus Binatia bacterium]
MVNLRNIGNLIVAVACVLTWGSNAGAVIGIPDDVPAATLLFPFFKVDPTPSATTRQDTILVVTNTANPVATQPVNGSVNANSNTWVHFTVWSTRSQHVFDFSVSLTPHDVYSCSLLDVLVNPNNLEKPCGIFPAPSGVISQLRMGEILAGYVTADVVVVPTGAFPGQLGYPFADWNVLIGHMYLVDLPQGSATGFNAVSIESLSDLSADPRGQRANSIDRNQAGFYLNRCLEENGGGEGTPCLPAGSYGNRERIDGPSGREAQTGEIIGRVGSHDASLGLILRYFSVPELGGRSELWLWKDRNLPGTGGSANVAAYDEDENVHSITLSFADEVNFSSVDSIITPGVPGGWLRIKFTCGGFGYCGFNASDPAGLTLPNASWVSESGALQTPIQAVAYGLHFANSQDAALRWDAIFPAHRQYGHFIGGTIAE